MFRMSDLYFCIVLAELTELITFSRHQNTYMCSPYHIIRRLNLLKKRTFLELVAEVSCNVAIRPVYERILQFGCISIEIKING